MRDVGIFVWVVLLVVGVIGSMVSSIRKQLPPPADQSRPIPAQWRPPQPAAAAPVQTAGVPPQAAAQLQRLADALRTIQAPSPAPAAAAPAPRPAPVMRPTAPPPPAHAAPETARRPASRIFAGRQDLVRAVIAAEVLGKPRAMHDE